MAAVEELPRQPLRRLRLPANSTWTFTIGLDKKLIWRGTASKTLDTKAKPDKREKNLRMGIAKLLKNYSASIKKG